MVFFPSLVFAETQVTSIDTSHDVRINIETSKSVTLGEIFPISFEITTDSSFTPVNDITVSVDYTTNELKPISDSEFQIKTISGGGSYGKILHFEVLPDAIIGDTYINIHYSGKKSFDKAIKIEIESGPQLKIQTHTVNSLFVNAEFPLEISLYPKGGDVTNVSIEFLPPEEINFEGKTFHNVSLIEKDKPITLSTQLKIKNDEAISQEYYVPLQIIINYTDRDGNNQTEIKDLSYLLRPKEFFEFGVNGGFWIGEIYIAPYVSIGSIIMAPVGTILGILYKKYRKNHKLKQT